MSVKERSEPLAPGLFECDGELAPGGDLSLVASWCAACDRYEFPALQQCPACEGTTTRRRLSSHATISQFTNVNHPPPGGLVPVPYAVAVADFPEGISVLGLVSNATTAEELSVGDDVRTVAAEVGDKVGYAFEVTRLADQSL
jgi:uncharacterized OB-fold protein